MKSPIAQKTAIESQGREVKGRRLNGDARPAIRELILGAPTITVLADLRERLVAGISLGEIDASDKTREAWEQALWQRVLALILGAQTPEEATFVVNTTIRWAKPPHIALAIDTACEAVCKAMPSPAERLRSQGIIIEGITK